MRCRNCNNQLHHVFLDLGYAPPSNSYLVAEKLTEPELFFPLKLFVCEQCWLVQTQSHTRCEELLFKDDYAYFSSVSSGWLDHASNYVEMIIERLALNSRSLVVEVASNDGYLLKNFLPLEIPCLGIEPALGTAQAARALGIPVMGEFFGKQVAEKLALSGKQADLIIGNNVFAHVPAIHDFSAGLKSLLKPEGTITLEFPHLLNLLLLNQFDTVYHEHYTYLSLQIVENIFNANGLRIFDVEKLPTHGGSLRIYGCHLDDVRTRCSSVDQILKEEVEAGMRDLTIYLDFQPKADKIKNDLLAFLVKAKRKHKKVVAYGAAAKGNTLLNYAGIKTDLITYLFDAAPSKQGKFMPGSHIPILAPDALKSYCPDYVLILPWNISDEIVHEQSYIEDWGGKFIVSIPHLEIK